MSKRHALLTLFFTEEKPYLYVFHFHKVNDLLKCIMELHDLLIERTFEARKSTFLEQGPDLGTAICFSLIS